MREQEVVDGYTFDFDTPGRFYQCKGEVCYDDEHDEVPEEDLWNAAIKLEKRLRREGYEAEAEFSEKGWVEVYVM